MHMFIRSAPSSQPNNIRGRNVRPSVGTSVRPYVRPQKVCPISMKFGMNIEVDECCMTRFKVKVKVKVKVKGPPKYRKLHFSKSISSAIYRS